MSGTLYIWDFDGVISDSLHECLTVVSVATYRYLHPAVELTAADLVDICSAEKINELERWMRPLRPFIVRGQDYLWQYFNRSLFDRHFSSIQEYMEVFEAEFEAERDAEYRELFYSSRKLLIELLGSKYIGLFTTYQGAIHALRASLGRYETFICSARDRQALDLILGRHRIELPADRIYTQDYCAGRVNPGLDKSEQILEILNLHGGLTQPFVVIEDQVKAPAALQPLCPEMRVIHAGYGYGLDEDWASAGFRRVSRVEQAVDLIYEIF
ncbi:hypothetical protein [Mariprofundus sp. KV]|uniref:hypothetical protein n=1 Tax=Mariprofundus sp. KV TaxID=2608715 RepID=UPI00159FDB04|nr:hypothetical protein [Mariprofundus sp. KV]NWF35560.1 hypothetical protein [Mariprofundus sp. KV]